jgi:putative Mg2+ transporter-C (MgtC) family protein
MPISETEMLLRLGTSVVLGGLVGYEREMREQPAGLRTHLLVALASATFMIVSAHFAFFQQYDSNSLNHIDGSRIASNVVVGIGFLGGGAILHSGLRIKGLTTAASLWLSAALGLSSGAGMYVLAAATTLISLFALVGLRFVEARNKSVVKLRLRLDLEGDFLSRKTLEDHLRPVGVTVSDAEYSRDKKNNRTKMTVDVRIANASLEEPMINRLEELSVVQKVRVRRLE